MLAAPAVAGRIKVSNGLHQLKGAAPVRIMGRAVSKSPVLNDLPHDMLLLQDRSDNKKAADSKGATGPGNIMQIKIGDRRGNHFVMPIEHRVMNQGNGKAT